MTRQHFQQWLSSIAVSLFLGWPLAVSAQTFSSGSTGTDGPLVVSSNTTLALPPDGVFNFTTVDIQAGATLTFTPNAANTPVTILATGEVTVAGTIALDGTTGGRGLNSAGVGGPGGFNGGLGRLPDLSGGSGGFGPGGGNTGSGATISGTYGAPASFVSLLPLFGGSGGGGNTFLVSGGDGASGAGGGGAIVIASSTRIVLTGTVRANGGTGNDDAIDFGCVFAGSRGSGGAVRLVAPEVTGAGGTLQAIGGPGGPCGVPGGDGRIRLEAFNTTGLSVTSTPPFSVSVATGPVTATSTPALIDLPTLTFSSVGGIAAPANPGSSYTTADVSLPPGTSNPVPIILAAANIPLTTVFTVSVIPQSGGFTAVNSSPSSGNFASAMATANVNLPTGQVSILNAFGSFTLPQIASLFPLIDGEPVERIMVAATYGGPSTVTLITKSGKEVRADRLNGLLTGQ